VCCRCSGKVNNGINPSTRVTVICTHSADRITPT
jgi:hypothetical protein